MTNQEVTLGLVALAIFAWAFWERHHYMREHGL